MPAIFLQAARSHTHIPHARKLVVSFVLFLAPVLAFKGDCEFTLSVHVKSCVFAPGYMSEHLLPQAVGAMQEKLRWPVTQAGEQQIWVVPKRRDFPDLG